MTWNYRVVYNKSLCHLTIKEVYYEKDKPVLWTENSMYPSGCTLTELKEDLKHMTAALKKPIMVEKNNGKSLVEYKGKKVLK